MIENIATLLMLILLQAVLGFDNLLYISLESKRVALEKQAMVRRVGILLAIVFRLLLLFVIVKAISSFQSPLFELKFNFISGVFNFHSIIVLFGGVFVMYTAMKEIAHMMILDDLGEHHDKGGASVVKAISWIVIMNLVFSFDSILSAIALTDVFWVMALAVIISGIAMVLLADTVANFLSKNRMYEVLGLFVLLIVGVMLLSEGGHLAHLKLFGHEVTAMSKSTFYFVIATMVVVEIVQSRYSRKLRMIAQASRRR